MGISNSKGVPNFQSLQLQYNKLTMEYNQAVEDYQQLLKSKDTSFIQLKNKAFYGKESLEMTQVESLDVCEARCSTTNTCSGATYSPINKMCNLRRGEGSILHSPNNYAIITTIGQKTQRIKELNSQLSIINTLLRELMAKTDQNNIGIFNEDNQNLNTTLLNDYQDLFKQREDILSVLKEYNSINASSDDTSLLVSQKFLSYRLHLIILMLLICLILVVVGTLTLNMILIPFILAIILYLLNMASIAFAIIVGIILYYMYQIPMN